MTEKPSSIHDWTVHVLNIQGSIFERWVANAVRGARDEWKLVATQFAVEFPEPNGPIRGRESVLDVRASFQRLEPYSPNAIRLNAFIECKKNNPDFIDWVFFEADASDTKAKRIWIQEVRADVGTDALTNYQGAKVFIHPLESVGPVTDDGYETKGTYDVPTERKNTKTSTEAISNACHQVALATQGILAEEQRFMKMRAKLGSAKIPYFSETFLPLIVTTANLKTVSFDPASVDPASGTVAFDAVSLKDAKWLSYLYPLPRHLQFAFEDTLTEIDNDSLYRLAKLPIIIIQGSAFEEFLQDVVTLLQS